MFDHRPRRDSLQIKGIDLSGRLDWIPDWDRLEEFVRFWNDIENAHKETDSCQIYMSIVSLAHGWPECDELPEGFTERFCEYADRLRKRYETNTLNQVNHALLYCAAVFASRGRERGGKKFPNVISTLMETVAAIHGPFDCRGEVLVD